ncbi:MAG: ATP-binding protein [Myxococcota bacterium]|nr:ATP-binding protein [Myxococcota bacterium]
MVDDAPVPRILRPPKGSFFLLGPRGTGKSTWLRSELRPALTVDLLDESRYQSLLADPGQFATELAALPEKSLVVVDEIQRLPNLLNEVHRHIERRGMRFALCGSSARKLKQSGTNLLAGRAVQRRLHPFVPEELGARFDLDSALRHGLLPVAWVAEDPEDTLRAYVELYLREEVQAEALVRNLPGFARFLPVAALFHGQTLNTSSLARDAGVARTTVEGYLGIIEDTLLAFRVPGFEGRLRMRERRHPKLYFADAGIVRALGRRRGPAGPEERGHLFEGWIAALLRAYRDYRDLFDEWYHWAPAGTLWTEVDFLLERAGEYVAIEVKTSQRVPASELKGLRAIADLAGVRRRLLVFLGRHRQKTEDGIEALPLRAFLDELESGTLFPGGR